MESTAIDLVLIRRAELVIALNRAVLYEEAVEELRYLVKHIHDHHHGQYGKGVWVVARDLFPIFSDLKASTRLVDDELAATVCAFCMQCHEEWQAVRRAAFAKLEARAEEDQEARVEEPSPVTDAYTEGE